MITSATASDPEGRLGTHERLVQLLKDFQLVGYLQTSRSADELLDVPIPKTKAAKQWYVKASDLTDLPTTIEKRSTLYNLKDIIRKAEERHGTQLLYEMVFDSKEAFQIVTKAQAKDDPHFVEYKEKKRNQLSMYLQKRIENLAEEARGRHGEGMLRAVQEAYLRSQEEALMHLKATFWNREEELTDGDKTTFSFELAEQEKALSTAKEIASTLLFGKTHLIPDDDHHLLFARWLADETDDDVITAVDGGVFGRPVTPEGMREGYRTGYPRRFAAEAFPWRAGRLLSTASYYAAVGDTRVGHVDCLTVATTANGDGATVNVGWIFMVYVVAGRRGEGIGSAMVRAACETYLPGTPVRLAVLKSNLRAKRFYEGLGFKVVDEQILAGGYVAKIMQILV